MTDVLQPKMAGSGGEVKFSNGKSRPWTEMGAREPFLPWSRGGGADDVDGGTRGYDEVDALPETLRYNWFDLLCTLISIVTYLMDLVMDCIVAYYFYHLGVNHGIYHYWYFGLTIFFIVFPSLTMTGFSFRWYLMDSDDIEKRVSTRRWILRLVFMFFQVAPILRYMDSIRYGLLSRIEKCKEERAKSSEEMARYRKERVRYYTLMVYEDADATLLRLFESFMESAPQLVLQIYILIKDPHANRINNTQLVDEGVDPYLKLTILVLSVTSSLVSLAWSLVVYHRSLRYTFQDKKNISLVGTLFQFLWQFSSITARVLALALFASVFPKYIGPLCAAHWMVMSFWVIFQRTAACNTHCEEFLFALVLGAIYIFSFFNAKEEQTRNKYLLYFSFSFVENTALLAIWFWRADKTVWYVFPALLGHYLAFFGGIMFMLCYYIWFHPTGIEMPFFKCLQGRRVPLASTEVDRSIMLETRTRTEEDKEEIRASASSPDLIKDEHDGIMIIGKERLRRSYSVPPRSQDDVVFVRKLKCMGQKSQDST